MQNRITQLEKRNTENIKESIRKKELAKLVKNSRNNKEKVILMIIGKSLKMYRGKEYKVRKDTKSIH